MATEQDSFCAVTDVELNVGRGSFSGTSKPTLDQVLSIMAGRSAAVEAIFAKSGVAWTVQNGASPINPSNSEIERRLDGLCNDTVAAGAAAQVLLIMTESELGQVPEKTAYWEQQWTDGLKAIEALITAPSSSGTRAAIGYSQIPTADVSPSTDW